MNAQPTTRPGIWSWFNQWLYNRKQIREIEKGQTAQQLANIKSLADKLIASACEGKEPESAIFRVDRMITFGGRTKKWIIARLRVELNFRLNSFVISSMDTADPSIFKIALGDVEFMHRHRPALRP